MKYQEPIIQPQMVNEPAIADIAMKGISELEKVLRELCETGFDVSDQCDDDKDKDKNLKTPVSFQDVAKKVFNGYIEIASSGRNVKIYPTEIEFYYHEETGDVKDMIVYHKNDAKNTDRPMFKFGMLNNHVSGIDITFEHYNKMKDTVCRASILIRKYKISGSDTLDMIDMNENEKRPTYLPCALLSQFSIFDGFTIKWREYVPEKYIITCDSRIRTYKYDSNGKKTKEKDNRPWKFTKAEGC